MGNGATPTFTTEKAQNTGKCTIRKFEKRKPSDVKPYIDFEKGWKFKEDDKEFLILYYEDWIKGCIEEFDGDGIEEPTEILKSLKENGVEKSKNLIQANARILAEAVNDDIYNYYAECPDDLKLIENSILDIQW